MIEPYNWRIKNLKYLRSRSQLWVKNLLCVQLGSVSYEHISSFHLCLAKLQYKMYLHLRWLHSELVSPHHLYSYVREYMCDLHLHPAFCVYTYTHSGAMDGDTSLFLWERWHTVFSLFCSLVLLISSWNKP